MTPSPWTSGSANGTWRGWTTAFGSDGEREPPWETRRERASRTRCSTSGKELDEDALCALIADAVSQRRTHSDALLRALAQRERYPRRILLQEMLGQVKAG